MEISYPQSSSRNLVENCEWCYLVKRKSQKVINSVIKMDEKYFAVGSVLVDGLISLLVLEHSQTQQWQSSNSITDFWRVNSAWIAIKKFLGVFLSISYCR